MKKYRGSSEGRDGQVKEANMEARQKMVEAGLGRWWRQGRVGCGGRAEQVRKAGLDRLRRQGWVG